MMAWEEAWPKLSMESKNPNSTRKASPPEACCPQGWWPIAGDAYGSQLGKEDQGYIDRLSLKIVFFFFPFFLFSFSFRKWSDLTHVYSTSAETLHGGTVSATVSAGACPSSQLWRGKKNGLQVPGQPGLHSTARPYP